ncbi:MAG TPA: transposase [Streptosporangiaceae bacterium]
MCTAPCENIQTRRPIDLLPDREAATFAAWLGGHPGTRVLCRDRAGAYADGARTGAPGAIQVADRWHLWHNLADHLEKTVLRHRACLREPVAETPPVDPGALAAPAPPEKKIVTRTKDRYTAVQELRAGGASISAIARILHLDVQTVRRFAHAAGVDELLAKTAERVSVLDGFAPYLQQRWNQGCTDAARLTQELRAQGYAGSDQTVRRYLRPFRHGRPTPPAGPVAPTVREVSGWILRRPTTLDDQEQTRLEQVLARCRHLEAATAHVAAFAEMLIGLHGDRLDNWIAAVQADELPELHSFCAGLKRDHAAVVNGLTLPYSSGLVEGHVNRIKMLKRQMYGRAGFALLRKRVLLAT